MAASSLRNEISADTADTIRARMPMDLAKEMGRCGRSARGLETRAFGVGSNEILVDEIGFDTTRGQAAWGRLNAGPSRGSYGTATILMATASGANCEVGRFRTQ